MWIPYKHQLRGFRNPFLPATNLNQWGSVEAILLMPLRKWGRWQGVLHDGSPALGSSPHVPHLALTQSEFVNLQDARQNPLFSVGCGRQGDLRYTSLQCPFNSTDISKFKEFLRTSEFLLPFVLELISHKTVLILRGTKMP